MIWNLRRDTLSLERPLVMGIINITPDSFYDGGRFTQPSEALKHAIRLKREGADLLDLGAESTRPGASPVSESRELDRLLPVLDILKEQISVPISIDTTKATVARAALERGADIVNDVSGLASDPEMAETIAAFGAGVVVMHRRGTPQTMQSMTQYDDLMGEIRHELEESVRLAEAHGIGADQIVVDPGIGFSKTAGQNLELLKRLHELKTLGRPVLVGPSRKSFIGAVTGEEPEARTAGTIAACVMAFAHGAGIFRVHDVSLVKSALSVAEAVLASGTAHGLEVERT